MRKLLIVVSLSFGLATTLSAHQRAAVAASAPPVVARAMPAGPPAAGHVAPVRAPAHVHSGSNVAPAHPKPVVSRKTTYPSQPLPPPPLGGFVNSVTGSSVSCNKRGGYPPLQGLSACPPVNGGVLPFYGGAYYIPVPYYVDSTPQEQGQNQEDAEQVASNVQPDTNNQQVDQGAAVAAPVRSGYNNLNESLAEFVFVQRDGSKLYAVAYSFLKDKLQYVTKEGVRHSVALDSLDLDATQKLNEQLGNTINLPNLPASGVALNVSPAALQ
jgi:hypothetical protein